MVGEIRDHETAEIAIHASLTGHLVLSTLHTNDAAGAVTRLVEMGVQPFHISSSLMAVLAQRLVRKLCGKCRTPYFPSNEDLRSLGIASAGFSPVRDSRPPGTVVEVDSGGEEMLLSSEDLLADEDTSTQRPVFYRPVGCEACAQTGYRGRIGIYEMLVISDAVRKEILNNGDSNAITRAGVLGGMRTLRTDGARQVLKGITSVEEVLAATQAGDLE
jgi:general secretion pathway protein E